MTESARYQAMAIGHARLREAGLTCIVHLLKHAAALAARSCLEGGQLVLGAVVPGHQRVPHIPRQLCMCRPVQSEGLYNSLCCQMLADLMLCLARRLSTSRHISFRD